MSYFVATNNDLLKRVTVERSDGSEMVVTPWQLLQWKSAIAIEAKGLKFRGPTSVYRHAYQYVFNQPAPRATDRARAHLIATIEDLLDQMYPTHKEDQ